MSGTTAIDDPLQAGREAMERRDWPAAYERLSAANAENGLGPEDLELLAKASWWNGHANESIETRERAYSLFLEHGDRAKAAFAALTLRRQYATKNAGSIAQGWLARAEELLEDEPESTSTADLEVARAAGPWGSGDLELALEHIDRALDIASRFDDRDLWAWALHYRGMILVDRGDLEQGWALMEQTCASAAGGELGAYTTGGVFCNVINVCRDLADYRRGSEWADVAKRWCERHSMTGFPGVCRVHRAEIMRLLGSWSEADEEVRRACEELKEFSPSQVASAYHELGEVRFRMGDLQAAEDAFRQAHELGEDPQPGLALLLMAEGKLDAAAASIRRSLEDETWNQLARARLLPAQAAVAHAARDAAVARAAADELVKIAEQYPITAIRANAESAGGLAHLTEGDATDAVKHLRRACQLWKEVDAPFEAATTAVALAQAHLEEGDEAAATLELETAKATFERLGALPSADRAAGLLGSIRDRGPSRRAVRTFLFTDIVGSTALLEAIGDEDWHRLRNWHDDTLRRCFANHGGEEVDNAGDGFFVAFPDAGAAIACAVEIQRALAEHRRSHGFAPQVRMGLHATDASRTRDGYSGKGVHVAARIGGLARAGEILTSVATIEGVAGVTASETREVDLKGITEPMRVVTIDWDRST
jgi:class 3 adenylate cyclase